MQTESAPAVLRVYSEQLDKRKTWYLYNEIIWQLPQRKIQDSGVFKAYPNEFVVDLDPSNLKLKDGKAVDLGTCKRRKAQKVVAGTSFSLVATLISKDLTWQSLQIRSTIEKVIETMNAIDFSSIGAHGKTENQNGDGEVKDLPKTFEDFVPVCSSSPVQTKSPERSIAELEKSDELGDSYKKRKIRERAKVMFAEVNNLCIQQQENLPQIISLCCINDPLSKPSEAREVVKEIVKSVSTAKGCKKAFEMLIDGDDWERRLAEMRIPDWQMLLFKLQARISDEGWQCFTNLTKLGRTGKSSDTDLFLNKNHIKALRSVMFHRVRGLFDIKRIPTAVVGYQVDLQSVLVWCGRDMRLHGQASAEKLVFNLKLDGRPFFGREQVVVAVVPLESPVLSNQSSKAVFPLAIANCKENRRDLKELLRDINRQKALLKSNGLSIDGRKYKVAFKVTLDLKALYLLLTKCDDESFVLGGNGIDNECCFICAAKRGCNCDLATNTVCLKHFASTKANIGSFKGIRDDLTFLLEEDLTSINICALHCEMRNTEQLLGSVGLLSFQIGALDEYNEELKKYGPETFSGKRVSVKLKHGQETAVEKHNISVASFSGGTERKILENIGDVVKAALPLNKLQEKFKHPNDARMAILKRVTFCQERLQYYQSMKSDGTFVRDFGTHQEKIPLAGSAVCDRIDHLIEAWQKAGNDIDEQYLQLHKPQSSTCTASSQLDAKRRKTSIKEVNVRFNGDDNSAKKRKVASKQSKSKTKLDDPGTTARSEKDEALSHCVKVCEEWREIATTMRNKKYASDEEHLIDVFELKLKGWGFLLRELFGPRLGCGDYGHLTVEHVSMLMRNFRTMRDYVNQGLEAAHAYQKTIFSRSTSHDGHGYATSLEQILTTFYTEKMLYRRLCFREANACLGDPVKPFYFRGCGWPKPHADLWDSEDRDWIVVIDSLFSEIFGGDYFNYYYDNCKCSIDEPSYFYSHEQWEGEYVSASATLASGAKTKPKAKKAAVKISQHPPEPRTATKKLEQQCTYPDLELCLKRDATRGELSTLKLPPVRAIQPNNMQVVINPEPEDLTNPLLLSFRPPESTVRDCCDLLAQARRDRNTGNVIIDDGDLTVFAVKLGNTGTYTQDALDIWIKANQVCEIKWQVREENKWLDEAAAHSIPVQQVEAVRLFLTKLRPSQVLLRSKQMYLDARDFACLVGERYLTGYCINVICCKLVEEARQMNTHSTLFLPNTAVTWATAANADDMSLEERIEPFTSDVMSQLLKKVLIPVHVRECHWGLLCLDIVGRQLFYDDGLHWDVPSNVQVVARNICCCLFSIFGEERFQHDLWDFSIRRLGMPLQPREGIGSSSCGVGVILAARDMIQTSALAIPSFKWSFEDAERWRMDFMYRVVGWSQEH